MENFGDRLKFLRAGLSQTDLASALNIKQTTLSNYERCRNEPNFETLKTICSHFGVNAEWFMYGTGPMRPGDAPQATEARTTHEATTLCARCAYLEEELALERAERREVSAENRRLWRENGSLREKNAALEERQRQFDPAGFFSKRPIPSSNETQLDG